MDDSLKALHSAIASNPKQAVPYKALAYTLMAMNRMDDAMRAWQDLMQAVPDDPDAGLNLGTLLVQRKRYFEAIPLLEEALKIDTDSFMGTLSLAQAYLLTGDANRGRPLMTKALELGPAPLVLNDVAYALADSNLDLTDALDYAQKAVRQEEEATQRIDLSNLTQEDLLHDPALASYWDTLGWVHFRMGHLEQSEDYLNAAWHLSQYGTVGDHLAQVEEAQHKNKAAERTYLLTLATLERKLRADRQEAIRSHVKKLDPAANFSTMPGINTAMPTDQLIQARTVKLPKLVKGAASAEFFVLFGPGPKVESAHFVSGSEELRAAEKTLSATVFQVPFPSNSSARILRRGLLMCSELTGCEMVLYPVDSVRSVN